MAARSNHKFNGEAPLRVVHVVPALFDADDGIIGGEERYALELARHMARETPTTLMSFGARTRQETREQLRIRIIGNPWYVRDQRTNPVALALLSELRKADVVHCHQKRVLTSSLAALAGKLSGRRVFVSDHGGGGWDLSGYVSTDRWYHGHLHVSEYSRQAYGQAGRSWAHVILGGVDTERFSPAPTVQRNGKVVFVGRLLPHKGVDVLIQGLPEGLTLEVIGQPHREEYLRDLNAMAAGRHVVFRHDCNDEELVRAYREAMCVVLPSVYKSMYGDETVVPELLGQTLLEGMACGAPAICTDVASMPEVVADGLTGFVVPPNDPAALEKKLSWLREHPGQAEEMGRAARSRVLEKFMWSKVVDRCLEIYAS